MISKETIEQIKERVDLATLAGGPDELTRRGRDFWRCCPFHEEKTPSFKIDPEIQTWHCFGCGETGNVITFVMKTEGSSFIQAVRKLAGIAGITLDAGDLESSNREIEALFAWLRRNPDIREFDEASVAERYISLLAEHEQAKAKGKPGWMRTPANQIRDELIRKARKACIACKHSSMSENLSEVRVPARVVVRAHDGRVQCVYKIDPAPTSEFIETLASKVWNLSDGIPYTPIRELCENFIHAYFSGVAVTISRDGKRIRFDDQGPGIDLSSGFREPGYSTATEEMKPYIRGLGEGYSTIASSLAQAPQHISLIFGDKHGKGLSVYLVAADEGDQGDLGRD